MKKVREYGIGVFIFGIFAFLSIAYAVAPVGTVSSQRDRGYLAYSTSHRNDWGGGADVTGKLEASIFNAYTANGRVTGTEFGLYTTGGRVTHPEFAGYTTNRRLTVTEFAAYTSIDRAGGGLDNTVFNAYTSIDRVTLATFSGYTASNRNWGGIGGTLADQTDLQNALNAKQNSITGGATTITGSDLTASRALISNTLGKVAVSSVTSTELSYLSGVTSGLQAQLTGKVGTAQSFGGDVSGTYNAIVVANDSHDHTSSTIPTNSFSAAGLVPAGAGSASKVWKTDGSGIPGWRDDATGSSPTFDSVGGGTNTTSTMTVGTGGTLTYSGSGVLNASKYKGQDGPSATEFAYLSDLESAILEVNDVVNNVTAGGTAVPLSAEQGKGLNTAFVNYTTTDRLTVSAAASTYKTQTTFNAYSTAASTRIDAKLPTSTFTAYTSAGRPTSAEVAAGYQSQSGMLGHLTKSVARHDFYGPRGVTLNSVGGYAYAKFINYTSGENYAANAWPQSLERVAFGMQKAAELGMTTVTEWAIPGNWFDYQTSYNAAGDFAANGFGADDDWTALDLTMQLARKYGIKLVLRIPNNIPTSGSTTKYSQADYITKYLVPVWSYIATRYADYSDVIKCIDWGFELSGRYGNGSTFFSSTITAGAPYYIDPGWVTAHLAVRNAVRAVTTDIPVALGSTNGWIANGALTPAALLDQMYSINASYVNEFDRYILLDYYASWNNVTSFGMKNNDPFDSESYFGDPDWLTDGDFNSITDETMTALTDYGRTDVKLACPEGGYYLTLQDTYDMGANSDTVTLADGGHNFLTTEFLDVGEKIYIGDDSVVYTVATLGGGSPAGSSMTVTPNNGATAKEKVRIYHFEREETQYNAMRWIYREINKAESKWDFFNWFHFWDNSTSKPLGYPHYVYPGITVYAQKGHGFIESDTLKPTSRAAVFSPEPTQNAKTIQGRPVIFTNYTTGQVLKFDASGNIINGEDTGTGSLPASLTADETNETLTQASTVESNAGNPIASFNVQGVFNGGVGAIAAFENTYVGTAGAPVLLRRSRDGGASATNDFGGTIRYQYHDGTSYYSSAEVSSKLIDSTTGGTVLAFTTQASDLAKGNTRIGLLIDEEQNLISGKNTNLSATGGGGGAKSNLLLHNSQVTAPTAGVTDAVALYATDLNGAGTTGLNIRTEDNKTVSVGTTSAGTGVHLPAGAGVYVDGAAYDSTSLAYIAPGGTITCNHTAVILTNGASTSTALPANCTAGKIITVKNYSGNSQSITATNYVDDLTSPYVIPSQASVGFMAEPSNLGYQSIKSVIPDCDNATTSKLLFDAATNTFTCGTDQSGGSLIVGDTSVAVTDTGDGNIAFTEDNAEVGRITGGYLGLGTTTPQFKIDAYGTSSVASAIIARREADSATAGGALNLHHNRLKSGSNFVMPLAGDRLGVMAYGSLSGTEASATARNAVVIDAYAEENWTAGSAQGAALTIGTTLATGASRTEKFRVQGNGNIRLSNQTVPASTTAACTVNTFTFDSGYLYLCTATDTWRRVQITGTW